MQALSPTEKHVHALPYVLLSVSPQLAALHATRSTLPHVHFCSRCGAHSALHSTSVQPSKNHSLTVCNTCGYTSRFPFDKRGTSSSFPSPKNRSRRVSSHNNHPQHSPSVDHKKKPGLAEILHRNRQKSSNSSSSQQTALSAFLTTL